MGNRTAVQANQAELPAALLLWRERQRHQDTDLSHAHRQPASDGAAKPHQTPLELLGTGNDGQGHAHVLCQCIHILRATREGLTQDPGRDGRGATGTHTFPDFFN